MVLCFLLDSNCAISENQLLCYIMIYKHVSCALVIYRLQTLVHFQHSLNKSENEDKYKLNESFKQTQDNGYAVKLDLGHAVG